MNEYTKEVSDCCYCIAKVTKTLLCIALFLCGTIVAFAQDNDTYRWVEQNGVYTLAGKPQKGDEATIKIGEFYSTPGYGNSSAWCNVSGLNTATDKIYVFSYPISDNGIHNISGGSHKDGWNDVYLKAIHQGDDDEVSEVQISDFVMPISSTYPIETISNIYDIDGDGKMEFLRSQSEADNKSGDYNFFCSYQYPGLVPGEYPRIPDGRQARLCHLNNDGIPDVRYLYGGNVALSEQTMAWHVPDYITEAPYPCDYNNDGLTDLMQSTRMIYRQGADGNFTSTEIIPITSEEDTLVYNRWDASHTNQGIGLGNLGGDVGVPIGSNEYGNKATFSSKREFYSMDFNKDGHEDLIDETTGTILLNRGNNRFLTALQSGRLYMRDLNGDFITDYISYDEKTRTVESWVFQKDGSMKRQVLMSNLAMDERIYFYDFNKDGYVDVLLPFSSSSSTGEYSYLVLAVNDGNGNFNINEDNTYRRPLYFVGCADVNSDGYYDVLALEPNLNYPRTGYNDDYYPCDLYWLKGNSNFRFEEMPDVLIPTTIQYHSISSDIVDDAEAFMGDFDNDGICDILVHGIENTGAGKFAPTNSFMYTFTKETITPNRAPQKPDMPTFVADVASGMLQVNWQMGTDEFTPQADLTYALRIGTEPGKGDVLYAASDADGRRLNLLPGNMEYNLTKTLNVSGWKKGNYYIAVQTIDAMGKGSAWSDEAVYYHDMLQSPIYIPFKDVSTADTVTMAYDGIPNLQYTYNWELDGGTIVSSEAGGSTLRVVYDTPGLKNIELSVTDSQGNTSAPQATDVSVRAVRFDEKELAETVPTIRIIADVDNSGSSEALTQRGVYQSVSDWDFEKAPGIYNTDLEISAVFPWDYNRDGLVDFIGGFNADYSLGQDHFKHNLMLNQGNGRFAVSKAVNEIFEPAIAYTGPWFDTPIYDFNNDGLPDYYKRNKGNDTIYENTGDWQTFIEHPIKMNYEEFYDYKFAYTDINSDNLTDIVCLKRESVVYGVFRVVLFINRGNFEFQRIDTEVFTENEYARDFLFVDLNNDGIKEIIDRTFSTYNIHFSQDGQCKYDNNTFIEDISYDCICYDLDNNGYIDLISPTLDRVFYNYGEGVFELKTAQTAGNEYSLLGNATDGNPIFLSGRYAGVASSRIANTRPNAPTGIRAVQDADGYFTINWNAAEDAETPYVQMRYNLSVKKQGASGENAFVVSPLNALSNDASPIPDLDHYLSGTQYRIPLSAMEIGKYEISIQSIDGRLATSAFSQPLTVEVFPTPLLALPERICRGKVAVIRYIGTEGKQIDVDFGEDAELLNTDINHTYEVIWNTIGYKNVTVTVDGVSNSMQVYVNEPLDASFTLPEITLTKTNTYFEISDDNIFKNNKPVKFTVKALGIGNDFTNPWVYGIRFERKEKTKQVRAYFEKPGSYIVRMTVTDDGCGDVFTERSVDVVESMGAPEISLVTVDNSTGKNKINWKFTDLPDYITSVGVYKESAHYNKFELLEEVDPKLNGYIDMSSNPAITTSRYRICLNTSFGVSTESSTAHQSVHLTVNRGINGSWNLIWNAYVGRDIDNYRILRGTTPDDMVEIATIAGSATSYTDFKAPDGVVYYAIAYDAYYEDQWQPVTRGLVLMSAQSNTVSVVQAQNLQLAEDIYIKHLEEEAVLDETQSELHLYADIYPVSASCKNVNWTIVKGEDMAYITPQGLLVGYGSKAGEVVVRATTIDGTQLYKDITVTKKSIIVPVESITIYPYDDIDIEYSNGVSRIGLKAIVYPENATDPQVNWHISEGDEFAFIEQDEFGQWYLCAKNDGSGIVEAISTSNPEIKCTRRFTISGFSASAIDSTPNYDIKVYPRMVIDEIHIGNMSNDKEKQIYIMDLDGRCRYVKRTHETDISISCSDYSSGIYLIKIIDGEENLVFKFIKK